MSDLNALFAPRSIAVIGAGRERGSVGGEIFHNLLTHAFTGPVYPVNAKAKTVQSVRAYPSIQDVPDEVDLAVIVVPRDFVQGVVEDCGRKGVKALIVISAGFGETGETGVALQAKLLATVRELGMRMVGPNCLGVLTTDPAVRMDASFAPTWPPRGRVSFSSQSGALGLAILDYAKALGIGVRSFVSVGNKADISGNDLIEWWETDPETDVILLYLESFGNPRKFINLARRVAKEKPIVAVKSGRTAAGSRAASSHTGALAGEDSAVDALFAQTGVIRTDTIEELFDMSMLLANQPVPASNRLAIVTNAGGPGIMATDACESRGLVVTPLSEATMEKLRGFLPSEASVKNPVDMIASASAESYGKAVRVLLEDPQVDSLLVIFVPPIITEAPAVAAAVREALATTPAAKEKTILACFLGTRGVPESLVTLQAGKVPSYAFPEAAAIALSRAVDYGKWKRLPEPVFPQFRVEKDRAAKAISGAREKAISSFWLDASGVRDVLGAYGIRMPQTAYAKTADDAARLAKQFGVPVAVKLESRTLTHKTEVGGVKLNLKDARRPAGVLRHPERAQDARQGEGDGRRRRAGDGAGRRGDDRRRFARSRVRASPHVRPRRRRGGDPQGRGLGPRAHRGLGRGSHDRVGEGQQDARGIPRRSSRGRSRAEGRDAAGEPARVRLPRDRGDGPEPGACAPGREGRDRGGRAHQARGAEEAAERGRGCRGR